MGMSCHKGLFINNCRYYICLIKFSPSLISFNKFLLLYLLLQRSVYIYCYMYSGYNSAAGSSNGSDGSNSAGVMPLNNFFPFIVAFKSISSSISWVYNEPLLIGIPVLH